MSSKTAYVWGPISSFSSSLLSAMLENGWQIHLPSKSVLQITLSPLDLASSAQHSIEKSAGGPEKFKQYRDSLVFLDGDEPKRDTIYDIVIFTGLPCNFDEPRVSRAPWSADDLKKLSNRLKGVPVLIVSSLWGGIQNDGVVPEEIEFERRKPRSHFEAICQQYESKALKFIEKHEGKWHLVRLPLMLGSSVDGRTLNFTGLYHLLQALSLIKLQSGEADSGKTAALTYNPDSTLWMLPCDSAANLVLKLIEDGSRPNICNLVSTQSTLSQEWMQSLAEAIGLKSVQTAEKDGHNLPGTLRSILNDSIHVKTRNLFEVLGRYHEAPMTLGSDYFKKVLNYAAENNWGQSRPLSANSMFSAQKARQYFEHFMPANLDEKMLKTLASFEGGILFEIAGEENCAWLLRKHQDKAVAMKCDPKEENAAVKFVINADCFTRICSGKMLMEQALFTRALQVSGGPIQSLRGCDFLRNFLRRFPLSAPAKTEKQILESAAKD